MKEARVSCRVSFKITAEYQALELSFEVEKECTAEKIGLTAEIVFKKVMLMQRKKLPGTTDKFAQAIMEEGPKIRKAGKKVQGR